MPTRTLLTTPPGERPTYDEGLQRRDPERYSPGLGLPSEPRVPGPRRRLWIWLTTLGVLAVLGLVLFRLFTAGQFEDPALSGDAQTVEPPSQSPAGPAPQDGSGG